MALRGWRSTHRSASVTGVTGNGVALRLVRSGARSLEAMTKPAPQQDPGDDALAVTTAKQWAAGVPGVLHSLEHVRDQVGLRRGAKLLLRLNQPDGFDCPGCAWPEPAHRSHFEFCENGAKAIAEEATLRRVDAEFFAEHSVDDLAERSDYWLGQQGRLTDADVQGRPATTTTGRSTGTTRSADRRAQLRPLRRPDRAVFYTSGRTSNEAAFLYQLFVRALRHEQPARLLEHVPRVERRGAHRDDRHRQGHRHPRRHRRRRPDRRRRPEPRHQPPADAHRAGDGQAATGLGSSRSTRCPRPG